MVYINWILVFEVIDTCELAYSLQKHWTCYAVINCVLTLGDSEDGMVVPEAVDDCDTVVEALHYLSSPMLSALHSLEENIQHCNLKYKELGYW